MRLIKAFLRKEHEIGRFDDANEELKRKTVSSLRLIETTMPVLMLVMNVAILIILWLGSEFITTGDIQVGKLWRLSTMPRGLRHLFPFFMADHGHFPCKGFSGTCDGNI